MTTPVVTKYLALAEYPATAGACASGDSLNADTGVCTTQVATDPPGFLPTVTGEVLALALMVGVLWIAISSFGLIEDAVRDD